jgi:hypothetical protein
MCTRAIFRFSAQPSMRSKQDFGPFNGDGYDGIPLERNAYQLGQDYERQPNRPFSVSEVVSSWISEQRF